MAGLGPLLLVALLALVFAGFYFWARRQGLVEAPPAGSQTESRISYLTEAVSYVGAILILAGVITSVGQQWRHISDWGHVGLLVATGAFFLLVGLLMRQAREPALQRLTSVTWVLAVGALAGAAGFASHEVYDAADETTLLAVGITAAGVACVLWLARRRALQLFALFVGTVLTVAGIVSAPPGEPDEAVLALSLWALGLAWLAGAWRRYLEPLWAGLPLGVLLALVAPSLGLGAHGWMYAVGIVTAAGAMALGVRLQNTPLLGLGTVATFAYVTGVVVRYFSDTLGVPATLAVTGVLVLALALLSGRLMRSYRTGDGTPTSTPDPAPADRVGHR